MNLQQFALPALPKVNPRSMMMLCLMLAITFMVAVAQAATTGPEWQSMAEMVLGWIEGWLGIFIAASGFTLGMVIGLSKGTAMPCLVGVAFAIACVMGPGIIQGMFTALI